MKTAKDEISVEMYMEDVIIPQHNCRTRFRGIGSISSGQRLHFERENSKIYGHQKTTQLWQT
jgi:hypothetical protein